MKINSKSRIFIENKIKYIELTAGVAYKVVRIFQCYTFERFVCKLELDLRRHIKYYIYSTCIVHVNAYHLPFAYFHNRQTGFFDWETNRKNSATKHCECSFHSQSINYTFGAQRDFLIVMKQKTLSDL